MTVMTTIRMTAAIGHSENEPQRTEDDMTTTENRKLPIGGSGTATPKAEPVSELVVMGRLERILKALEPDAQRRVMAWLVAKFQPVPLTGSPCKAVPMGGPGA